MCVNPQEVKRGTGFSASWEASQQSKPITALQRDGSGSPDPALTLSFIEKESFKLNLK